jgi:hypothetical protein
MASRQQSLMGFAVNFAFMLPVMMLTFGCTFLVVARFGSREARHWALGFLSAAVAFAVPMLFSHAPIPLQAMSAEALFLLAFYGYSGALLARFPPTAKHSGCARSSARSPMPGWLMPCWCCRACRPN